MSFCDSSQSARSVVEQSAHSKRLSNLLMLTDCDNSGEVGSGWQCTPSVRVDRSAYLCR